MRHTTIYLELYGAGEGRRERHCHCAAEYHDHNSSVGRDDCVSAGRHVGSRLFADIDGHRRHGRKYLEHHGGETARRSYAGSRGHDFERLQRHLLWRNRELLRGWSVSDGNEPASVDRPVLLTDLTLWPPSSIPDPLSGNLGLFRYRRVEVSAHALYRRRSDGGTTASCGRQTSKGRLSTSLPVRGALE